MGTLIFSLNFSLNLLKNSKITVPLPWEEAHEAVLGREDWMWTLKQLFNIYFCVCLSYVFYTAVPNTRFYMEKISELIFHGFLVKTIQ